MGIKISGDGSDFTNVRIMENGSLKTVNPKRNAVIIDYFETCDEDGNAYIDRVVSLECKDEHMEYFLREHARKILQTL